MKRMSLVRNDSISDGSDTVAPYSFLGLGTPVIVNYPDPSERIKGTGAYNGYSGQHDCNVSYVPCWSQFWPVASA